MNFCPGSKNSIIGKTLRKLERYDRIINELCHFYKVALIKISFIEPIASFHEIQKITKMSFNIPLKSSIQKFQKNGNFNKH